MKIKLVWTPIRLEPSDELCIRIPSIQVDRRDSGPAGFYRAEDAMTHCYLQGTGGIS